MSNKMVQSSVNQPRQKKMSKMQQFQPAVSRNKISDFLIFLSFRIFNVLDSQNRKLSGEIFLNQDKFSSKFEQADTQARTLISSQLLAELMFWKQNARLTINNEVLERVKVSTILGVWIEDDLSWSRTCQEICVKAYFRLQMITKLNYDGVKTEDLIDVYVLFI